MTILASVIAEDSPQRDGRRWIRLEFTDQFGAIQSFSLLVPAGFSASAELAARIPRVDADLTAREIQRNVNEILALGSEATPTLGYSMAAENFSELRAQYQTATRFQAIMAGDYLSGRTDAQLRTAFGMTQAQVTTLRANKLTPAANTAATIRASSGA